MARRNDMSEPSDFLAVKGKFSLHITPQTRRGWLSLLAWIVAVILPTIPLIILGVIVDDTPQEYWVGWAIVPSFAGTGVVIWAMTRWMLARADVVTPEDLKDAARSRTNTSRRD